MAHCAGYSGPMSSLRKSLRQLELPVRRRRRLLGVLLAIGLGCGPAAAVAENAEEGPTQAGPAANADEQADAKARPKRKGTLDRTGRTRVGMASFYSDRFAGRRMADGTRMHLHGNAAASLSLPLGTTARVTNMETGASAMVVVRDRGPHVRGRIIDLSPATARLIGITRRMGVAQVEVAPVHVPGRRP